jgi:predicted porin
VSRDSYKSWEVVGLHSFSKRTLAYLGYVGSSTDGKVNGEDIDTLNMLALGVKHTF